ncbi:DEAD/DEAH box helicase family protein [Roseomonas eburnea]|uniref:DEAD/DEAH box helicase family protein n=1 Tax=Neoroseomonas eburnea TaxID=1346889 RepID=A0A9X9X6K0_9PROT|nr:DEAD/DEAH box helicase family protein [Neoroseomonas eburnea]
MPVLSDFQWRLRYTPEDGDLVAGLYVPLLSCAERYDRLTGYFSATALALAARGIEGLALNNGSMRLVVGCTLGPDEVAAIERGEALRTAVGRRLTALPLEPGDDAARQGLEILAWLVEQGRLEVKVAVPCDSNRRPLSGTAIFHEKAGIVEDKTGQKVAFSGSLNETAAGWTQNFESLHVFTSWGDPARVALEEEHFAKLWADKAKRALVVDVPQAAREDLLRFLPDPGELPAAMKAAKTKQATPKPEPVAAPEPESAPVAVPPVDRRRRVWAAIARAPLQPVGGERVAEATSTVTPWPHQVRAFERMYRAWPPRLLIADEVGLGKSLQAGLVMRQAMLAGRAKRILLMAPKAVVKQWQIELREKLNLNWPIYDGGKLCWFPSPAMAGGHERAVSRADWHKEPFVLVSSHLLRRTERQREVLEAADPWDLVVLDEAHHARRRGAGSAQESGPNALLRLMRGLRARTQGLVLLTATPMQVHPVEVWDLLQLLGLPPEWSEGAFLRFFEDAAKDNPSHEALDRMAVLFRAAERAFGEVEPAALQSLGLTSALRARKVLAALRDPASVPRRQLEADQRRAAVALMRRNSPVARLVSRHTRDLLRRYHKQGKLSTRIADRDVRDEFIELSADERIIYDAVEDYISSTYNAVAARGATAQERSAVGFVMTIYRRRLASSFHALRCTLEAHMASIADPAKAGALLAAELDEEVDEDEADAPEEDEAERLAKQALALEEKSDIERLLAMIRRLPPDTKLQKLRAEIAALRAEGFEQVMVFTGFTDTMDLLRRELSADGGSRIMCFSGRGGEVQSQDGTWRVISRDEVKRRFREGAAEILLCTDAAAEGLNFQFCGALINYDSPWNPMRVEQRIGRIDRLGQRFERIRIVNLHYADTVEADVYMALRRRIGLFQSVVGGLQPILARMPRLLGERVLTGDGRAAVEDVERAVDAARAEGGGFDLDTAVASDLEEPVRPVPALTLDDLDWVISDPALLPPGTEVRRLDGQSYGLLLPGRTELRVTTDPSFYDDHADATELWSPGSPVFPNAAELAAGEEGESFQRVRGMSTRSA